MEGKTPNSKQDKKGDESGATSEGRLSCIVMAESQSLVQPPLPTYLLLENDKKSNNLGPVLRCAAAYGMSTILAIGYSQCSVDGSHGASKHVTIVPFPTVQQAVDSIHQDRSQVSVMGVLGSAPKNRNNHQSSPVPVQEDTEARLFRLVLDESGTAEQTLVGRQQSWPVGARQFEKSKIHCFAICKSKHGLSTSLASHCDRYVHIPHRTLGGNHYALHPLLDLPACMSIVLHHYTEWAGYDERNFKGHKFELQCVKQGDLDQREERRNQRNEEKRKQAEEMESGESHALATQLFNSCDDDGGDY